MFRLWLCMPFGTPYQIPGGTDPLHLFSKLKPVGQVQLLCSAFKCLHGVVLAQHPSLSAWCSSSSELLRGFRTHLCTFAHAVPSTWRAVPTVAHLAVSVIFQALLSRAGCPRVKSSPLLWPWAAVSFMH